MLPRLRNLSHRRLAAGTAAGERPAPARLATGSGLEILTTCPPAAEQILQVDPRRRKRQWQTILVTSRRLVLCRSSLLLLVARSGWSRLEGQAPAVGA